MNNWTFPENKVICGLDEVGRGALAGPLVAAAVICNATLKKFFAKTRIKIKDSKLLTSNQRQKIYKFCVSEKILFQTEIISTRSINNHGIGWANKEIFRRLIRALSADEFIVDGKLRLGRINHKSQKIISVVNGDAFVFPVMLASIIAKVVRDTLMQEEFHPQFPHYGWIDNAGYGTRSHIEAIKQYGVSRYHRTIFVATALRNKTFPHRND